MWRGLLFQVWLWMTQLTGSMVGIQPGDSGVMTGYQVDGFTHTWSTEQFVAHSHVYPGFTGKVSSLYFPLALGCEDYFWTNELQTLNRAWITSSLIKLRYQNWTHPLMSLRSLLLSLQGFSAQLVLFLLLLNCCLFLVLGLGNYGARLGHFFPCIFGHII